FEINFFFWRLHPEKAPEVLESAPHRLQSSSAIPRHRNLAKRKLRCDRRQSRARKELVTSTAQKPWTHKLVSNILLSLPRFFFTSPRSIGAQK
ncbi:hypothetical protein HID58_075314, partial [Brassica napus]